MSESAFPFPSQGDASAAPVEEPVSGDNDRRKLFVLGAAAIVLVLVAAGYFLFLRGGSSEDTTAVVQHRAPAAATKAKAAAKAPAKQTVPQTFNAALGRDPFKPLVTLPPPAPAVSTTDATGAAATSGTAGSTSTPAPTTATGSQPVSLQKVYTQGNNTIAQTMVNGTVYKPAIGQNFAGTFQLLSVSGKTATFVQGDEQFSLSVGQVVVR